MLCEKTNLKDVGILVGVNHEMDQTAVNRCLPDKAGFDGLFIFFEKAFHCNQIVES